MKIIQWKKYTKQFKHWADKLLNCLVACGMALILWMLLQVTSLASFRIPTDSMQPTLIPGDYILVEDGKTKVVDKLAIDTRRSVGSCLGLAASVWL